MVGSQQVAGLVCWFVQYTDTVVGGQFMGAGQFGHEEDIQGSLPWPESDRVVVPRLMGLLEQVGCKVSW